MSPASQTIRHGASGPALNAASRSHDEIFRLTEKRPRTDDVTTGRSNSTVTGASAAPPTAPRPGSRWMLRGRLLKQPDRHAQSSPHTAQGAVRRSPEARRRPRGDLVRAVERGVDVDGSDSAVAALDLDDRRPISGQRGNRSGGLVEGPLGFGVRAEDVAILKQDDP